YRSEYLDELLALKGRGGCNTDICADCHMTEAEYQCTMCLGREMVCAGCCRRRHRNLPLHRIQHWQGDYFEKTSLNALNCIHQLGHLDGKPCVIQSLKNLVVLHTNGIHKVAVAFCHCQPGLEHRQQLLRMAWYPATPLDPETCVTFEAMKVFQTQNLQGNITAYDYYQSLEILTDGWGKMKLPDRRHSFMNVVRQWRNLQALKRAGRCHDPTGIDGTKQGELAVACRACPHPGVNLPADWEKVPESKSYLYRQVISTDANFRVKSRYRQTKKPDVCLSPGWAYFVEVTEYAKHYTQYASQEEIDNCVKHRAIGQANLKNHKGLSATGIVSCSCRHEMYRPNGIGDLQRGERFCNIDWVFLMSLVGITVLYLLATYDIACQYFTNFWSRMSVLPSHMHLKIPRSNVAVKVPKAHLEVHQTSCHGPFSLNWTWGAGMLDGEGVERLWAWLNKAASSVKEMGASARRETIDDFCAFAAWRKIVRLLNYLSRRLVDAIKQARVHREEFSAFDAQLRSRFPLQLQAFDEQIVAWEKDYSLPCPYISSLPRITLNEVRQAIAEEEERAARQAEIVATPGDSALSFVCSGLEIEAQQQALLNEIKTNTTVNALGRLSQIERRKNLRRKILELRKAQLMYMPGLSMHVRFREDGCPDHLASLDAEHIPLYLPSDPALAGVQLTASSKELVDLESRLREAQAQEALDDLRSVLRTRTFANKYKIKNVTGQRSNVRARSWQDTINRRATACAAQYRRARTALLILRGPGTWERSLKVLEDNDIRAINDRVLSEQEKEERARLRIATDLPVEGVYGLGMQDGVQVGEGRRTLSWIWIEDRGGGDDDGDPRVQECLFIEWAKAKARASRWSEEVELICEEMRRAITYCTWKANWWQSRAEQRPDASPEMREGLRAYALQHAQEEKALAARWSAGW
ncbi:hypothetical protein PHLGIDRAFT_55306, partial [Phlebiopsis gigantea 11061_1 CR5-6]